MSQKSRATVKHRRIRSWTVGIAIVFIVVGGFCWYYLPSALVGPRSKLTTIDYITATATVRQSILFLFGGALVVAGVVATVFRLTYEDASTRLQQDANRTDRFSRAIDQLGSESAAIQNGGIYALARLAQDSADDAEAVGQVLAAFIRTLASQNPERTEPERSAIIALASGITYTGLDLTGSRMTGLNLAGAQWPAAKLIRVELSETILDRADLTGTTFINVTGEKLSANGAVFDGATFSDVSFSKAKFKGATFVRATFDGATMHGVELNNASFDEARMIAIDLSGRLEGHVTMRKAQMHGYEATVLPQRGSSDASIELDGATWNEESNDPRHMEDWIDGYHRKYTTGGTVMVELATDDSQGRWIPASADDVQQ